MNRFKLPKSQAFLLAIFFVAVVAAGSFSAGCNNASPTEPGGTTTSGGGGGGSTTGTLLIQWGTDWSGCVNSFVFYVDGAQVGGAVAPGGVVTVTLTPGLHQVRPQYACANRSGSYCNMSTDGVSIVAGQTTRYGFTRGGTPCGNFCPGYCPQ